MNVPESVMRISLMTYIQMVLRLYNWSMHVSCNSFKFKLYIPSSAPIKMCWSLVSGLIQDAVQWILNGQPLNIYKQITVFQITDKLNFSYFGETGTHVDFWGGRKPIAGWPRRCVSSSMLTGRYRGISYQIWGTVRVILSFCISRT